MEQVWPKLFHFILLSGKALICSLLPFTRPFLAAPGKFLISSSIFVALSCFGSMNGGVFAVSGEWVQAFLERHFCFEMGCDKGKFKRRKEIVPPNPVVFKVTRKIDTSSARLLCPLEGTACLLIAFSEARHRGFFFCLFCFGCMSVTAFYI